MGTKFGYWVENLFNQIEGKFPITHRVLCKVGIHYPLWANYSGYSYDTWLACRWCGWERPGSRRLREV